jgi:hypothetical protein
MNQVSVQGESNILYSLKNKIDNLSVARLLTWKTVEALEQGEFSIEEA